jgi:DeoR/GlpR family transcriptional regulator of sugar metabolism
MAHTQFVEDRRNAILDRLGQDGRVSVNILSEEMGVSSVTIRQDLRALEQAGLLKRTYGGAIRRAGYRQSQTIVSSAGQIAAACGLCGSGSGTGSQRR